MDTISIIIVSFNTKALLKQCLASIFENQSQAYKLEVIVVDNASADYSAKMVQQDFPSVTVFANTENIGFGKANNQGLKAARGDYVFLLNPDTVVGHNTVEGLWRFCRDHADAGIVAPRLYFIDGSVQPSCYHLPTIWAAVKEYIFGIAGSYAKYTPQVKEPVVVEAAVGAAMLLPMPVIKKLGTLFDERFYFYYEDIDLCRRINRLGKKIYYLPDVDVIHHHGASASQRGDWAYKQNQKSAQIYFGTMQYRVITFILKYGQKWQKLLGKA